MIEEMEIRLNFYRGMFQDRNTKKIASVVNTLLEKTDEQTKVINSLSSRIKKLELTSSTLEGSE